MATHSRSTGLSLTRRSALLGSVAMTLTLGTLALPRQARAQAVSPEEARVIAQGGLHLRLSARGHLPHPIFLFRRQGRAGIQGRMEQAFQHGARLHARGQGDPDAELRHALFLSSAPTCGPSRWCSRCRRSRRAATTRCSSSTCTRSTSPMSAAGRPATAPAPICWRGRGWKGEKPAGIKEVIRLRDGVGVRRLPHAAVQSRRHRQRQEDPGRLQGAAAVGIPRQAAPPAAPAIDFIKPLTPDEEKTLAASSSTC